MCWDGWVVMRHSFDSFLLVVMHPLLGAGGMFPPIARFMGPTWGPSGADRTQVGPLSAPWTLLSGIYQYIGVLISHHIFILAIFLSFHPLVYKMYAIAFGTWLCMNVLICTYLCFLLFRRVEITMCNPNKPTCKESRAGFNKPFFFVFYIQVIDESWKHWWYADNCVHIWR